MPELTEEQMLRLLTLSTTTSQTNKIWWDDHDREALRALLADHAAAKEREKRLREALEQYAALMTEADSHLSFLFNRHRSVLDKISPKMALEIGELYPKLWQAALAETP